MRGRRTTSSSRRRRTYRRHLFGGYLDELLSAQSESAAKISERMGIHPASLSGYRSGRYLPEDRDVIRTLAHHLAPAARDRGKVYTELVERWQADLLDASLRSIEMTPAEARKALARFD